MWWRGGREGVRAGSGGGGRRYARLVGEPDAGRAELRRDEPDEAGAAAELEDGLVLEVCGALAGDVAREDLGGRVRAHRHGAWRAARRTSPAGHAMPPQPGDASTASVMETVSDVSEGNVSSIV